MIKYIIKTIIRLAAKPLEKRHVFITGSLQFLKRHRQIETNYFDYIRLSTLELVATEINNRGLKGNVAELGVYRGGFAKLINEYFPDRSLYLFDTFEGFDKRDAMVEKEAGFSTASQDFSNTSVQEVLKVMPNVEKCIPKIGFFPETAEGLTDEFVFVSLDADLYEPIYKGLAFFYPKLVSGGYIFVHDFNNEDYKGARKAVEQFCKEQNINFLPLPDLCGTAIITK